MGVTLQYRWRIMNSSNPVHQLPSPKTTAPAQPMKVSFTPVDYDYYSQWARSPRQQENADEVEVDSGIGPSPESETGATPSDKVSSNPQASEADAKSFPKCAARDVRKTEGSERSIIPRITKPQCRSASMPYSDSYTLPPLAVRRSTTVMGYERLLKKVPPENTVLPMNQAVFLFKGDVFVQNTEYLSEPSRLSNLSSMTMNSRYYTTPARRGQVGYGGLSTGTAKARRCVHIPKVQFIDFDEIKSYVAARKESFNETKTKPTKDKQFVPLSFQLKLNTT